ncbi:MAG: STAS domain-containing protein [Pleurocapsa minor GSE-CHR-MK-17-07R]|jgi:anti-anti-sigma factor|nr:STAS domain-containing protein [Pleurocapsa minor GSE-CHR-MK 17-07R]
MMPNKPFSASLREPVMHLNKGVIIDLHGEINGTVEVALNAAYDRAEAEDVHSIVLNFGGVDYINSTGIALIVGLLARARKSSRLLIVFGLSDHYMDIFNITRLVDFMNVYPDEQSAVAQLSQLQ